MFDVVADGKSGLEGSGKDQAKLFPKYLEVTDWKEQFAKSERLDLFRSYGRTWKNIYTTEIQRFASRHGVRIRVIHPNPEDPVAMEELARRFNTPPPFAMPGIP
jgi:hypothetical protein